MRRHKQLRPFQALRQPQALLLRERVLQRQDILRLFVAHMRLEISPEGVKRGHEVGVCGFHVLDGVEFFFYLCLSASTPSHLKGSEGGTTV